MMTDAAVNATNSNKRRKKSLIPKRISELPSDVLSKFTFVGKPGIISRRYHLPAIPLRRARAFTLKRKRLISSEVAETVDFKDIISTSARFQATAEHIIPTIKPVVSESGVACAILNLEDNKTNNLSQRYAEKESEYLKSLRGFGIKDAGSNESANYVVADHRSTLWPDNAYKDISVKKRNILSGGRLFQNLTCRDASGTAGEHRSLLLSNCIKQYRPSIRGDCLTWSDDYDVTYSDSSSPSSSSLLSSSSSSSSSSFSEPFRPVPSILREMIRNKLYLLQSHVLPEINKDCSHDSDDDSDSDDDDEEEEEDLFPLVDDSWTLDHLDSTTIDSAYNNNNDKV